MSLVFYAVAKGHNIGIYNTWDECKKNTIDFENPIFRKFETEKEAQEFIDEQCNTIFVYTDGACYNNGSKNATAGIGVYFSKDNENNISRKLEGTNLTNNIAELVAAIEAINIIKKMDIKNKIIVTDSEYVIKCATTYGEKLEKKNWISTKSNSPPPNVELVKKLYEITKKYDIKYKHIMAHTEKKDKHSICNYYADKLANESIYDSSIVKPDKDISNKIYFKVKYADKDEVKKKGGKWDSNKKQWYIFENNTNKDILIDTYK